jgi:phage shock protein A
LLALAEKELIKAIADAEQVKRVAQNNYHSLLAKAEELQGQANQLYQAAQKSLQTGNEEQAQQWLRKKSLVDERISEYKTLLDQAQQLLHQLEAQHQDLQFRLESTRLKGQMLIAKVEAAKTQKLVEGVQNQRIPQH